jgi:hypothetical protein
MAWSFKKGINCTSLYTAGFDTTTWAATMTAARLQDIRATGHDWIRITYNPTDLLSATTSAVVGAKIAAARVAIQMSLNANLKVLLDNHVSGTDSGWDHLTVFADYPNGNKWYQMRRIVGTTADLVSEFSPESVAYHLWNEYGTTSADWSKGMLELSQVFWSHAPKHTVVVSSDQYSGTANVTDLSILGFKEQTIVAFTPYLPAMFVQQGVPTTGDPSLYHGLAYEPIAAQQPATDPEDTDGNIGYYYSIPEIRGYITSDHLAGIDTTNTAGPEAAAAANRLPLSRMMASEFGAHGLYTGGDVTDAGATNAAKACWLQDIDQILTNKGIYGATWHFDNGIYEQTKGGGDFSFRKEFLVARGLTPTEALHTDVSTAATYMSGTLGVPWTALDSRVVDAVITMLDDISVWDSVLGLWLPTSDIAHWKINLKNPGINSLTENGTRSGAFSYTPGLGYQDNGGDRSTAGVNYTTSLTYPGGFATDHCFFAGRTDTGYSYSYSTSNSGIADSAGATHKLDFGLSMLGDTAGAYGVMRWQDYAAYGSGTGPAYHTGSFDFSPKSGAGTVGVCNSGGTSKLYLDGSLDQSDTVTSPATPSGVQIGKYDSGQNSLARTNFCLIASNLTAAQMADLHCIWLFFTRAYGTYVNTWL